MAGAPKGNKNAAKGAELPPPVRVIVTLSREDTAHAMKAYRFQEGHEPTEEELIKWLRFKFRTSFRYAVGEVEDGNNEEE